jgi:hypothetical protein
VEQQVGDRRHDTRFTPPSGAMSRATLRPGCLVALVDVSAGGALVEAPRPLRPGARVHLQVTTATRTFAIAAQVTRCLVWSLDPIDGVTYRGALRFEQRIEWTWGDATLAGNVSPESSRPAGRIEGHRLPSAAATQRDALQRTAE